MICGNLREVAQIYLSVAEGRVRRNWKKGMSSVIRARSSCKGMVVMVGEGVGVVDSCVGSCVYYLFLVVHQPFLCHLYRLQSALHKLVPSPTHHPMLSF